MANRITDLSISDGRLDPTEADVYIRVYPAELTSTTQVRGRLMGPNCPYAATVEVAYHLREFSREYASTGVPHITVRARVPEPNWWHPATPFLYRGVVELWQSDECCERVEVRHGLRVIRLGPAGFKVNGKVLSLRGIVRDTLTDDEARRWHDAGCNALLADVETAGEELWAQADRYGFLVLGRIPRRADVPRVTPLRKHTSHLGWLLDQALLDDEFVQAALPFPADDKQGLGVELRHAPAGPLPPQIGFVTCGEELLPELIDLPLPVIALARRPFPPTEQPTAPDVLGTIFTGA
jgi:hypothetical protein